MKKIRWLMGTISIFSIAAVIFFSEMPPLSKYLSPLILAGFLALFRIVKGPTAADRAAASDVLGILIIGISALFAVFTKKYWYLDIGIAWALQSFIGVLALAKYLEGRNFDD